MNKVRLILFALLVQAAALAGSAQAGVIPAGSDFYATQLGTSIDLGSGPIPLMGLPFGGSLGDTDTIIERTADITTETPPPGTPNLLMTALQLESGNPVTLGGFTGNIFISLDPANLANNVGLMAIGHDTPDTGTFLSFFDVFFDVCTAPGVDGVGCGLGTSLGTGAIQFGPNTGNPWADALDNAVDPGEGFYPGANGEVFLTAPNFVDALVAAQVVPEPGSMALLGGGLLAAAASWRKRKTGVR